MYVWDEEAEDWVEADGAVPGETAETGLSEPGFWDTILSGGVEGIQKLFSGKSIFGDLGKVLAAGGVGTLLNKAMGSGNSGPMGYRGGIPAYTATRTQTPLAQQQPTTATHDSSGNTVAVPYRPGQGGITYFNPIEYKYQGSDIKTPMADPTYTPPAGAHGGQVKAKRFDAGGSAGDGGPSDEQLPSWLTELVPQILSAQESPPPASAAAADTADASATSPARKSVAEMSDEEWSRLVRSFSDKADSATNMAFLPSILMGQTGNAPSTLPAAYSELAPDEYAAVAEARRMQREATSYAPNAPNYTDRSVRDTTFTASPRAYELVYGTDPGTADPFARAEESARLGFNWGSDPRGRNYFREYGLSPALRAELERYLASRKSGGTSTSVNRAAGGNVNSGIAMLAGGGRGKGRFLRGPGDGVSDSIPAKFEGSGNPARLADGEFVIDARTVSEIGNGSSEAGARKLYEMMDRVHAARKKATRGKPSKADKFLPK